MKNILYTTTLTATLLIASCASVQKLVDNGQYDDAIYLAAKRLSGKKNPKTKHIKALEEAFTKVNQKDLSNIALIKDRRDPSDWDAIYNIATDIAARQDKIAPFLPLISKNGYEAYFTFANTNKILNEAALNASQFHYKNGMDLLKNAKLTGDKLISRQAYYALSRIDKYYNIYESKDSLKYEAKRLGTAYVLVQIEDKILDNSIRGYEPNFRNEFWTEFHSYRMDGISYDLISELILDDIRISPEREIINRLVETNTIEKWVDQIGRNGEIVKDSTGNTIQVLETESITARVREITRTKEATLSGIAVVKDYITGNIINEEPFSITVDFNSDAYVIRGDRRALSERIRQRSDRNIDEFPSDIDMILDAKEKIIYAYEEFLSRID